ncbi:hypothetical protein Tco_1328688 [Tanacetum coccineum]
MDHEDAKMRNIKKVLEHVEIVLTVLSMLLYILLKIKVEVACAYQLKTAFCRCKVAIQEIGRMSSQKNVGTTKGLHARNSIEVLKLLMDWLHGRQSMEEPMEQVLENVKIRVANGDMKKIQRAFKEIRTIH